MASLAVVIRFSLPAEVVYIIPAITITTTLAAPETINKVDTILDTSVSAVTVGNEGGGGGRTGGTGKTGSAASATGAAKLPAAIAAKANISLPIDVVNLFMGLIISLC